MSTNNKNPEKTISIHGDAALKSGPRDDCPWRKSNHGKRHPGGFFRKNNLQRLWNQIRKGGGMQTCHPTDPSHPDHCTCGGAKKGSTEQECAGSVVLITRELRHADRLGREEPVINMNGATLYLTESRQRKGLTREGLLWFAFERALPRPIGMGMTLPAVSEALLEADWIGRPDEPESKK